MDFIIRQAMKMQQKAAEMRTTPRKPTSKKTEPITPLHERLRSLLNRFDPADLVDGLDLHTVRERLDGKKTGHAHAGELGEAFRKLGWVRKRNWRKSDDGFRSRWYPPAQAEASEGGKV